MIKDLTGNTKLPWWLSMMRGKGLERFRWCYCFFFSVRHTEVLQVQERGTKYNYHAPTAPPATTTTPTAAATWENLAQVIGLP